MISSIAGTRTFLSTPSARRATAQLRPLHIFDGISIHALREEGDLGGGVAVADFVISIHALREEGDMEQVMQNALYGEFLSTPSARRATVLTEKVLCRRGISIHALREEGDH